MASQIFNDLIEHLSDPDTVERIAGQIQVPSAIGDGLARLLLLYDVPFNYLVADERLLPPESIKFFHLDYDWIQTLLDGAMSMGSVTRVDALLDGRLRAKVYAAALQRSKTLRPGNQAPAEAGSAMTGFLLRSVVVDGWPGLEVNGYGDAEEKTRALLLRMDRVAPDILLCLFDGLIQRVSVHLPPEGLHFGVDIPDAGDTRFADARFIKALRGLTKGQAGTPLDPVQGRVPAVAVPLRKGDKRVIRASALRDAMTQGLPVTAVAPGGVLTSAEFAIEMTQGVDRVSFDVPQT